MVDEKGISFHGVVLPVFSILDIDVGQVVKANVQPYLCLIECAFRVVAPIGNE